MSKKSSYGTGCRFASISREKQMTLEWRNIVVRTEKRDDLFSLFDDPSRSSAILRGVSGIAEPGKITTILGCSGAGKSTLLNVLAGRSLAGDFQKQGHVTLNGVPISDIDSLSQIVGYIQQHDVLPEVLTVKEYLLFTAELILPHTVSKDEKMKKVKEIINQLSLDKCADVYIGGERTKEKISGGERKRLCIALKLLKNPQVLILDEPTSGLDSYIAGHLVKMLRDLAKRGYTILCTLHQPSSEVFTRFNNLILLANGRCAYSGPASQAVTYFSNLGYECPSTFNPADFFIKLITIRPGLEQKTRETVDFLCDCYDISRDEVGDKFDGEYSNDRGTMTLKQRLERVDLESPATRQFLLILQRDLKGCVRAPQRLLSQTFSATITTIFLASLYYNPHMRFNQSIVKNLSSMIFLYVAHFSLLNAMALLQNVAKDMPLVTREARDGLYGPTPYYLATIFKEIVVNIYLVSLELFGTYYLIGLKREPRVVICTLLVLIACIVVVNSVCFLQAAIWEDTVKALHACIPIAVFFNVLGGYFINPRSAPKYVLPIFILDWIPWAFEIVSVLQWRNVTGIECELKSKESCVSTGEQVIERYGFDEEHLAENSALLVAHVIVYNLLTLGYFIIKIRSRRSS